MVRPKKTAIPSGDRSWGVLAGVDEAGLGPVLGPLVVAGVAMTGPRGEDPWKLLSPTVCRNKSRKGRLRVADSKKLNQGPHGLLNLERTVLTFWGALHGDLPKNLSEMLEAAEIEIGPLRRCPWYDQHLDLPLPLLANRDELTLKAHMLRRTMDRKDIHVRHIAIRPVDAAEFNELIEETDNKSHTHFHAYSNVIANLLRVLDRLDDVHVGSGDEAHLVADRCGGRFHYRAALSKHLPGRSVKVLEEHPDFSSYMIARGDHRVRISFAARGEDRAFPTALASCAAKYVRELMMECLNRWFRARMPGLKRTAGYYVDGHRFLEEVESITDRNDFPMEWLRRVR